MTAFAPITAAPADCASRVAADAMALPLTTQIALIQQIAGGRDFADLDGDNLDRLDMALRSLSSEAREAAYHEDRALHGSDVGTIPLLPTYATRCVELDPVAWDAARWEARS